MGGLQGITTALAGIRGYLKIADTRNRVTEPQQILTDHMTSNTAVESIGKWRKVFSPSLAEHYENIFEEGLREFGYSR
jgi:hypothetical protein